MSSFVARLLPVFSNLFYLLPAASYLRYGRGFRAILFFTVALFTSPVYHLCKGFYYACLWDVSKHHVVDFWTADLVIPISALYFIRFRSPFVEKWLVWILVIVVGLFVTGTSSDMIGQSVLCAVSFTFVGVYVVWHRIAHGYWPEYDLLQLTLGIAFTILSLCFFVMQNDWPAGYNYMHSFWHIFGGIAQYFMSRIREPADPMLNLESGITAYFGGPFKIIGNLLDGIPTILPAPEWEEGYAKRREQCTAEDRKEKPYTFLQGFELVPITRRYPRMV